MRRFLLCSLILSSHTLHACVCVGGAYTCACVQVCAGAHTCAYICGSQISILTILSLYTLAWSSPIRLSCLASKCGSIPLTSPLQHQYYKHMLLCVCMCVCVLSVLVNAVFVLVCVVFAHVCHEHIFLCIEAGQRHSVPCSVTPCLISLRQGLSQNRS